MLVRIEAREGGGHLCGVRRGRSFDATVGGQISGISGASRDNTGSREYFDGTVLPSIEFPSDHAVVSAVFHIRRPATLAPAHAIPPPPAETAAEVALNWPAAAAAAAEAPPLAAAAATAAAGAAAAEAAGVGAAAAAAGAMAAGAAAAATGGAWSTSAVAAGESG